MLPREVSYSQPSFKIMVKAGIGVDNIGVEAATKNGILVPYTGFCWRCWGR